MANGSSATGHCSSVDRSNNAFTSICSHPTSSVLFDGVIPTLTGLDGDMWASQLLTLNSTGSIKISFAFSTIQIVNLRVELVMFSCPEWGISVQSVKLKDIVIGSSGDLNSITSCDSLVRLCVPATAINPLVVTVQFDLGTDSNWVHLAEVTFYNDNTTCPPDTTITTEMMHTAPGTTTTATQMTSPTTPPPATTIPQDMTTDTTPCHIELPTSKHNYI